jgi:hypothetical protein
MRRVISNIVLFLLAAWAPCGCDDVSFEGDPDASTDTDTDSDTDTDTDTGTDTGGDPFELFAPVTDSTLNSVWGFTDIDVWAVGDDGAIVHFDGSEWSLVASGTTLRYTSVWGAAPDDVWAVGYYSDSAGAIMHYDGDAWTKSLDTDQMLLAVGGSAADDVYAVGVHLGLRWDGAAWTEQDMTGALPTEATGIRAFAPDDVFLTNLDGVKHFDGTSWETIANFWTSTNAAGRAWGNSATDLFVAREGDIVHWDGSEWATVAVPADPSAKMAGISGAGSTIVAVGMTAWGADGEPAVLAYDGAAWSDLGADADIPAWDVWAASATEYFLVGIAGGTARLTLD